MSSYEIVNMITGEVTQFETKVDIDLLEEYNRWVVDNKLNPPKYSPQEYAMHLESENAKQALAKAIEMVEFYHKGTHWNEEMVESLLKVLRNEE